MNLVRRRGLPALLGLALTAGVVAVATPAHAAGEAPTGAYALDLTSILVGQHVKLTQTALADDDVAVDAISRSIAWGDGTTSTAAVADTTWNHTYAAAGSFSVTVTLNDGDVAGPGTFAGGSTVTVGTNPGSFAWQKPTIYTNENSAGVSYLAEGVLGASGLPGGSTNGWTDWKDGESTLLSSNTSTSIPHWYGAGSHTPSVHFEGPQGTTPERDTATLNVQLDTAPPSSVYMIYPSSPTRGSSWTGVHGKAADSQSGMDVVGVVVWKYTNSVEYIYNFATRSWIKVTSASQSLPTSIWGLSRVDSAGQWSVGGLTGVTKGYHLDVGYYAMDKVGNATNTKWATVTMTS